MMAKRKRGRSPEVARFKALAHRREPNGRLSRRIGDRAMRIEMTEAEAKSVMIEARMRHTGLPRELVDLTDAGRPNAGTAHGILRLRGALTADQWSAAEWWLGKRNAYLRAISAPGRAIQKDGDGTDDEDAYAQWCKGARADWKSILACLADASVVHRTPVFSAFDVVLVRGVVDLDHLHGDLRLGLNALSKQFLVGHRKGTKNADA